MPKMNWKNDMTVYTHTHASLKVILPGEPGLAGFSVDSPCLSVHPTMCPSQIREGMVVNKEEWCRVLEAGCLSYSPTSVKDIHRNSSFLQPPTDS